MNIRSGAIFVWEESDNETGLRRWTDSRLWSQSRMREPFLFYDERLPDERYGADEQLPIYRFIDGTYRGVPTPAVAHYDRSNHHPKGLVKQAYSARVSLSPTAKPRKWHLTAYFSYEDLEHIPTVDQDTMLQKVTVPPGVFRNGKARSRDTGMEREGRGHSSDTETSSLSSSSPNPTSTIASYHTMSNASTHSGDPRLVLPPLGSTPAHARSGSSYYSGHGIRSAEDQRVIQILNSRHIR